MDKLEIKIKKDELKEEIFALNNIRTRLKEELYKIELQEHNNKPVEEKYKLDIRINENSDFEFEFEGIDYNLFLSHNNTITKNKELFESLKNAETDEDLKNILKDKLIYKVNIYTHSGSVITDIEEITIENIFDNFSELIIIEKDYMFSNINTLKELFNAYLRGYKFNINLTNIFTSEIERDYEIYDYNNKEELIKEASEEFGVDCSKLEIVEYLY